MAPFLTAESPNLEWGLRMLGDAQCLYMQAQSNFSKTGRTQLAANSCVRPGRSIEFARSHVVMIHKVMMSQTEWVIQASWQLDVNCCCCEQRGMCTWGRWHCWFWSQVIELTATCCTTSQISMLTTELLIREGAWWTCWCITSLAYLVYAMNQKVAELLLLNYIWHSLADQLTELSWWHEWLCYPIFDGIDRKSVV